MIWAMLSLDLIDSDQQRDKFYEKLATNEWSKAKGVDTVWFRDHEKFTQPTSESIKKIEVEIQKMLVSATRELKIKRVNYVIQIGNSEPFGRTIYENKDGVYTCYIMKLE